MKIGIITIHKSPSYGGSLQSYALYKYLKDAGHNVEIIDLYRPAHEGYRCSLKHQYNRTSFINKIKNVIRFVFRIKTSKRINPEYNENFIKFNSYIKLSKPYHGVDELYANPPSYDIYITGSDQVWNPLQPYLIEPYFLTFVRNKNARKISYAASMGINQLYPKEKKLFKSWIEKYDAVSVREEELKDYLQQFINKDIIRVADPTFLVDKNIWKELSIGTVPTFKYILLFELDNNNKLLSFTKRISLQANIPLIVIGQNKVESIDKTYITVKDAGPSEFLSYIKNAEMVITDSFHGTVFSIIMETKNFYSYISPDSIKGSRITDLLKTFKIETHLLNPDLKQSWSELINNKLNKSDIQTIYEHEQKLSRNFLDKNL